MYFHIYLQEIKRVLKMFKKMLIYSFQPDNLRIKTLLCHGIRHKLFPDLHSKLTTFMKINLLKIGALTVKILSSIFIFHWKSAIIFIIFWNFLMFYQIFLSLQVKQRASITYKHGRYELSHELPNKLKLRILGN